MAKWGKADYRQFQRLQKNIEELGKKNNMDAFCEACCKELAARLLALVIPRTPKRSGILQRGWGAETAGEAKAYAERLNVTKTGDTYTIEIINPVFYASYVEYGHRTASGGWVEGRYMLTISEEELEKIAPQILERKLRKYMQEVFNV